MDTHLSDGAAGFIGSERAFADALLAFCTPDMYAGNPYRLCGLDADAGPHEMRRIAERGRLAKKLGSIPEIRDALGGERYWEPDAMTEAAARLADPLARILVEYFWFWRDPAAGPMAPDPAITALATGDPDRARVLWENRLTYPGRSRVVAMHNLAVLGYARMMDAEGKPRHGSRDARYVRRWREVLKYWRAVAEDAEYWRLVAERIRRIADPRVPEGTTAHLRRLLPCALAQPHAYLLRKSAEGGDQASVECHRMIMAETGCGDAGVNECISRTISGLLEQLRVMVARRRLAPSALTRDAVASYVEQVEPVISTLAAALAGRLAAFRTIRDDAVQLALSGAIDYGNATRDWGGAHALLESIAKLPASEALYGRVAQNLATVRENLAFTPGSYAASGWAGSTDGGAATGPELDVDDEEDLEDVDGFDEDDLDEDDLDEDDLDEDEEFDEEFEGELVDLDDPIDEDDVSCPVCGSFVLDDDVICDECGAPLDIRRRRR